MADQQQDAGRGTCQPTPDRTKFGDDIGIPPRLTPFVHQLPDLALLPAPAKAAAESVRRVCPEPEALAQERPEEPGAAGIKQVYGEQHRVDRREGGGVDVEALESLYALSGLLVALRSIHIRLSFRRGLVRSLEYRAWGKSVSTKRRIRSRDQRRSDYSSPSAARIAASVTPGSSTSVTRRAYPSSSSSTLMALAGSWTSQKTFSPSR